MSNKPMRKYRYDGPIMLFDRCIAHRWAGETYAVSEKRARTNLAFRYKKQYLNNTATSKIKLPGKLILVEGE